MINLKPIAESYKRRIMRPDSGVTIEDVPETVRDLVEQMLAEEEGSEDE